MKKVKILALVLMVVMGTAVYAQSSPGGKNARGITGLIVTPSALLGWENADFGVDVSYSMINRNEMSHIPAVTISILRKAEIAFAYDIEDTDDNSGFSNVLIGGKFQLYKEGGTALALGGNFETITGPASDGMDDKNSGDIYLVATYAGDFFDMPAVTSMMIGWQIATPYQEGVTSDFNYSMGFELGLFPQTFKNYVYWINDFSNYSYAIASNRIGTDRGIFNTGVRVDVLKNSDMKLILNVIGTDLLDDGGRGFMVNATFGLSF
ncbi:MAG: hypothetical protein PQJ50_00220 [Spirochaetales bacterium]|nr:hypothetical protein [Spirochaetales bacterium]